MTADWVIIQLMSRKGLFMTGKKCIESLLLGVWMCGAGYGEHGPLLPRPQQIRYGSGSVAVRGMRILFSAAQNAEDRFAAEELGSWMRERTGLEITIASYGNGPDGQLSIVLDREGG